jgi:two-component system chemotaxis response regulator CheY
MPAPPRRDVMVIEDSADIRNLLGFILRMKGYRPILAAHGADALRKLRRWNPCLILLDLRMPVMDGFRFLDVLRREKKWARLPVMAFTGEILPRRELRRFAGLLEKPIDPPKLFRALERFCA